MNEKIIIIDGNAIIHRSFHALPTTLATKNGTITNAAYGFASFLIKALSDLKPDYAILTLDKKGPTFRHEAYDKYKATRIKAPQELYDQIPMVKKIASAFSLPIFELSGYEADDLIGTISATINKKNPEKEIIIITGDLDTLQLVNNKTKVYTMSRGLSDPILYDTKKIKERFKLDPNQLIDLKALKGDPSDNIPGVAGIGEKTAIELLENFSNLDNIYQNIDNPKIKNRTRDLLIKDRKMAYLSKDLGTIFLQAPINFDLKEAKIKNLDKNLINTVFSELEFKSLLTRVLNLNWNKNQEENIDKFKRNEKEFKYKLINDQKGFKSFLSEIKKQKIIALDTETTSLDALSAELLGLSFSWKENEAYFVNLKPQPKTATLFDKNTSKENQTGWLKELKTVIEDENIEKIGHNIKYDLQVLKNYQIEIKGKIFDTMIASYLLNPENRQHNLDALSFSELNWEKINSNDLFADKTQPKNFWEIDLEKLSLYSCEDADCTFKLKKILEKKLIKNNLIKLFRDIEVPLIKILAEIERTGILLDTSFLKKLSTEIHFNIDKIKKNIFKLAKVDFNINSTKQLKEILYEKMKINPQGLKKTKSGFTTASDELEKIKHLHPIIASIQEYRELNKLTSTYIDSLPQLISPQDKRIHTSFNQTITATGRLSSSDPNLQNIPTKTELGHKIRRAFIAPPGKILLSLDYSQIELRVMAHLSEDKNLLSAFKNNLDIHRATASKINKIKLEEVSDELRQQAKAINFGILYGQGPHGLSQNANIPYQQARDFINKYFSTYTGVKTFIDKTIKLAEKKNYTETLLGRKRMILEINSTEIMKKKAAERMAINSPIQGSAADIIKLAMIKILDDVIKDSSDIKMILQIHDELIFEIDENKIDYYYPKIKETMENIIKLKVPLIAEAYQGKNWGEMEKI
ncbi:MAG: DNA polymerase I [Patescibacteria group bacterium]|jgi:DNA polymerase-1